MVNRGFGFSLLLLMGFLLGACRSVENYDDPEGPLFEGNYAEENQEFTGSIKVETWNIAFGEDVESAINELADSTELSAVDILLLQEMDEAGVESIAQALGLNYVYYPASIHSKHDKNFGNAILSRWPLSDPKKIILPHRNPKNNQIRTATFALADIAGETVPVYSVHTETFWLGSEDRQDQVDALIDELPNEVPFMIVGGDFNTLTPMSLEELEERFENVEMDRSTEEAGPTVGLAGVGLSLDQIFTKGFHVVESGSLADSKSSDHKPLWVELQFNNN